MIQDKFNGNNVNDFPWQGDVRRFGKMVVKFKYPNSVFLDKGDGLTDFNVWLAWRDVYFPAKPDGEGMVEVVEED
jgi:hypothetical protein